MSDSLKDFKKFKKQQAEAFKEEVERAQDEAPKSGYVEDERFFNIVQDDSGEGKVTFRFLPSKSKKIGSIVTILKHKTERNGKYINVVCPKTFDKKAKCPICEYRNSIWNENEKLARHFTTSRLYITNILIVDDKVNPENNGKVFLFRFGFQIFKHIEECRKEEVEYYDFDEGSNFLLKIRKDSEGRNDYTLSRFSDAKTPICDGDEEKQFEVYNSIYGLEEFYDDSKVLTYDELQEKLDFFLSSSANKTKTAEEKLKERMENKSSEKKESNKKKKEEDELPFTQNSDGDDEEDIDFETLLQDGDDDIPF